jgi:TonB family protein
MQLKASNGAAGVGLRWMRRSHKVVGLALICSLVVSLAVADAQQARARLLDAPRPAKSAEASRLRLSGSGLFELQLDQRTGKVVAVKVLRSTGHPVLDASAVDGLKKWRAEAGTVKRIVAPLVFTASETQARFE